MGSSSSRLAGLYEYVGAKAVSRQITNQAAVDEICKLLGASGVTGGGSAALGGTCIGGYDALADYGNSLYSKAKEDLIRNIARDVFRALRSPSADKVTGAKISEVVEQLSKLVPDPRKGKNFNAEFVKSSGKQAEVCKALGASINSNYGARIINVDADANEICRQVSEVMYSLFTGLHSEFMSVAGDVQRILKNMDTVSTALEAAYKKQKEYVNASGDEATRRQSENTDALYDEIKKEAQRQRVMLQNLFNVVVLPSTKELVNSLEENQDFAGLVSSLKAQTGTREFSDKLSMLLSGISSVARNAELINKALKKLGMSTSEFKASKTSDDLHMKIYSKIVAAKPDSKRLGEMMKAANIVYANNYNHEAVSKLIDKSSSADDAPLSVEGGAEDEAPAGYWRYKSLGRKMEEKKKFRETMLKDFRRILLGQYRVIVDSANGIAQEIGKSIQLGPELDHFIETFDALPTLDRENLHTALSGYYKDATSKEERARFVDKYMLVLRAIEQMPKSDSPVQFSKMSAGIKTMLKSLDEFSDNIVKALTEIHVDAPHEVKNGRRLEVAEFLGGSDAGDDLFGSGAWVDFKKIQGELKYYKAIANIKINISRSMADRREYAEGYEQVLGEYAGQVINNITGTYKDLIDSLEGDVPASGIIATPNNIAYATTNEGSGGRIRIAADEAVAGAVPADTKKNLRQVWEMFQKAKINMVKVAQAVDLYMKAFSVGISTNPDILSGTVKMLESVEMVAKWYTDKSGDSLVKLFECFPAGRAADIAGNVGNIGSTAFYSSSAATVNQAGAVPEVPEQKKHYYEWLEARFTSKGNACLPGNPFIGRTLRDMTTDTLTNMIKLSEDSVKMMRALENILSAFQSVGTKFGELDPQSQTFMTAGQMFNHLCDYVKASAFTTEFMPNRPRVVGAVYRGVMTDAQININGAPANVPEIVNVLRPVTTVQDCKTNSSPAFANTTVFVSQDMAYNHVVNMINPGAHGVASPANVQGIATGVSTLHHVADSNAVRDSDKYVSIAMAGLPATSRDPLHMWRYHSSANDKADKNYRVDLAGWRDHFYDTDLLFTMTIKSIIAKVFTVVDAYRLFHRPAFEARSYGAIAPVRTILGGGPEVRVIPEALELYYRLPLLVEWYREQFNFDKVNTTDQSVPYILTMAPTIDGSFGDLTQIICEDAGNITEGTYTETQIQRIINEINTIWKTYKVKYPKATTRQIINAYVLEINRVIGFIKRDDITSYNKARRERYSAQNIGDDEANDFVNFDILNANGQYTTNRPAPSDRFITSQLSAKSTSIHSIGNLMHQIQKLRESMDKDFNQFLLTDKAASNISFSSTLRNYKGELDLAKDPASEYKIVLRMMQGGNKLIGDDVDVMVMVHEAVAAPLAVLYAIWRVMSKFNALMHGVSLVNIGRWNATRAALGGGAALPQNDNLFDAYITDVFTKLDGHYKMPVVAADDKKKDIATLFATALIGNYFAPHPMAATGAPPVANVNAGNSGFITVAVGGGANIPTSSLKSSDMLRVLLGAVLDLHSNAANLTTCSIGAGGNINIDFKPLQDTCARLLSDVKANILALRSSFSVQDILDKYENSKIPGSSRWIEENLMEVLFNDRDRYGLSTGITQHLIPTLNKLCSGTTGVSTGEVTSNAANEANESYGSMYPAFAALLYYAHSPLNAYQRDHVRFNSTRFPFNMSQKDPTELKPGKQNINEDYMNISTLAPIIAFGAVNPALVMPQIAFTDYDHLTKLNPAYPVKSLLLAFNQILRQYIYCNTDDVTLKTYLPLYEQFASGPAAYEVGQKKAFQDIFPMGDDDFDHASNIPFTFGRPLNAPGAKSLVFNSNAILLKQIMTGENTVGSVIKRQYLYENFAEIPESMRDKMKTNLPYFSKMLQQLYARAEFLFKFLNNSSVKGNVKRAGVGTAVPVTTHARSPAADFENLVPEVSSDKAVIYLTAQLTKFMELSLSLKKCADSVYRELNDKPFYYLETNKDFITDYKSRTGNIPFMPVSSMMTPLRMFEVDQTDWNNHTDSPGYMLLPLIESNSAVFKFNAGCKIIMARDDLEPNIDQMPGAKEIFNHYNSHASGTKISASDYANCVKNTVKLLRFAVNGAVYNRFYDAESFSFDLSNGYHDALIKTSNAVNPGHGLVNGVGLAVEGVHTLHTKILAMYGVAAGALAPLAARLALYNTRRYNSSGIFASIHWTAPQYVNNYEESNKETLAVVPLVIDSPKVIELTESASIRFSKDVYKNIIKLGNAALENMTRASLRTSNLLDMNIVPINVHAFMREVPFVNLFNYSYTFDRMAHEFINPEYYSTVANPMIMPANADISSTRELLVKLLVHPYADLGAGQAGVANDNGAKQYYALLASLFNGNDNMRLGTAKYLSDQLWHKVLLTSSAQLVSESEVDNFPSLEAGPAAYEATNAIIHYGTKTNASHIVNAGFLHMVLRATSATSILTAADSAAVIAAHAITHTIAGNTTAASSSVPELLAAAIDADAAGGVIHGDVLVAMAHMVQFTGNGNATYNNLMLTANLHTEQYYELALSIPETFNAAAIRNVFGVGYTDQIDTLLGAMREAMYRVRAAVASPADGGGLIHQADTAALLTNTALFRQFIVSCEAALHAGYIIGTHVPLNAINTTVTHMLGVGGGGLVATNKAALNRAVASANQIGTQTAANITDHINEQCKDVLNHCLYGAATTRDGANQLYKLIRNAQSNSVADITCLGPIPHALRGDPVPQNPNLAGQAGGVGFTTSSQLVYMDSDKLYDGMDAHLNLNLPGIDAMLITFNEFLLLMRPFRAHPELCALAKTLFLIFLYRADNNPVLIGMVNACSKPTTARWVKFVIAYMADMLTRRQPPSAGHAINLANAPQVFELHTAAQNYVGANLFTAGDIGGDAANLTVRNNHGAGARACLDVDFYQYLREIIILAYCNPFKVIDEVLPECIQFDRKNHFLSIASLPNMTPGLKIRQKGKKSGWSIATKTAMKIPEVIYCAELGRARFDTKLVRNLTWFVQLQRVMRVVLTNHLSWINSPVVRGLKIADAGMTELHGNDGYDPDAFTGANYKGRV